MARPKHSGYEPIIRVLAALPGTDAQVHERIGGAIPMQTVTDWLRSAVRTGIARIERVEHVGPRLFARHYAIGPGPSAQWQHASRDGGRSHTTVIALATLFDALRSGPMLVADLVEETGMDRRVLHRTLALLRQRTVDSLLIDLRFDRLLQSTSDFRSRVILDAVEIDFDHSVSLLFFDGIAVRIAGQPLRKPRCCHACLSGIR